MLTDIMTEFEKIAANEENNGGVSLYAAQETLRDDLKWKGYDYKQTLMDLRLRREKPVIQKKNTLEEYMSLTIK
jgi:hypothetical protein